MEKISKVIIEKERTINMYSHLWYASKCVLDAGENEPEGSSWQFLSSLLLTAFTFEAYMNHVGPQIIDFWENLEWKQPLEKFSIISRLILGFGVLDLVSGDQCANQGAQKRFASLAGVMNELEEPEVDGEFLLRNATVRAQPGAQQ